MAVSSIRHRFAAVPATLALALAAASPALAQDPATTGGTAAPDPGTPEVLVVGDSLAVGMRATFEQMLTGRIVTWDARSGRTTPQGLQRLRARLRRSAPQAVVISLGTNDGSDPSRFLDRLRRTLRAIPAGTCVVWADIFRPARKGAYKALNHVLRNEAKRRRRLHVVGWERAVRSGAVSLPDGLHPDAAGYERRSKMYAAAIDARC